MHRSSSRNRPAGRPDSAIASRAFDARLSAIRSKVSGSKTHHGLSLGLDLDLYLDLDRRTHDAGQRPAQTGQFRCEVQARRFRRSAGGLRLELGSSELGRRLRRGAQLREVLVPDPAFRQLAGEKIREADNGGQ